MRRVLAVAGVFALVIGLAFVAFAQDAFDWLPEGGKSLLSRLLGEQPNREDVLDIVTAERTSEEWQQVLAERAVTRGFTEEELKTLADYLALRTPVSESNVPLDDSEAASLGYLDRDGREILSQQCMMCHTLGPVVLQDKTLNGWYILLEGATHSVLGLPSADVDELAQYLDNTLPLPEEAVPEEQLLPLPGY